MTDTTIKPHTLPTLALDYAAGTMTNTLTGETATELYGVILGSRVDRIYWPAHGAEPRLPECVNGSLFGRENCPCAFAEWGKDGEPPECSEELSVLMWDEEHAQVMVLTARRTQVKTVDRYLNLKAITTGQLHDQGVTIRMKRDSPQDRLHRLTLLPGLMLEAGKVAELGALAERIKVLGVFGGL